MFLFEKNLVRSRAMFYHQDSLLIHLSVAKRHLSDKKYCNFLLETVQIARKIILKIFHVISIEFILYFDEMSRET